jgi:hypothetical protein
MRYFMNTRFRDLITSTYAIELLLDFVRPMKQVSDTVTIEFDNNKPLKLTMDFAIGSLQFYLAPRVA